VMFVEERGQIRPATVQERQTQAKWIPLVDVA